MQMTLNENFLAQEPRNLHIKSIENEQIVVLVDKWQMPQIQNTELRALLVLINTRK